MLRHTFIVTEAFILRCMQHHRLKIIYLLHPISAAILVFIVGFVVWYEMYYILPELCDVDGKFYKLNCFLAVYFLHNILGNMICCWHTDTSFLTVPKERQQPIASEAHLWHLCTHCQMLVPPRAWHCRLCNTCMLKRDHHCNITANCIGHANQRYFIGLLFNLTLGNMVACFYNFIYVFIVRLPIFSDPLIFLARFEGFDPNQFLDEVKANPNWLIINGAILKLSIFSMVFVASQLGLQIYMVSRGSCMYSFRDSSYDFGFWTNWRMVLGKRMFWTWLSPLINSPLPNDGTQWLIARDTYAKKPA
ncbi:probable palmitoyltransferase ZDHHC24 [Drosophila innubila]|uniref:probable palmitoyltransferase ZDHHC24 n=1 Tax=Drosophila innubila TaxID=198719 RepID=UPI00148CFC5A|nr:probable palmitoyltransferase ZDHHC24 [Drosophila innubila]